MMPCYVAKACPWIGCPAHRMPRDAERHVRHPVLIAVYLPLGLQLSNLNAPTCVAQLKLPEEM